MERVFEGQVELELSNGKYRGSVLCKGLISLSTEAFSFRVKLQTISNHLRSVLESLFWFKMRLTAQIRFELVRLLSVCCLSVIRQNMH